MSTHGEAPVSAGNTAEAENVSSETSISHPPAPSIPYDERWKYSHCWACGYILEIDGMTRCRKFNCAVAEDSEACPRFCNKYRHVCKCGEGFLSLQEAQDEGAIAEFGKMKCTCWRCQS